jgi:hypothetical protein
MTMLVNLTPHAIRVYPADTPDVIDPAEYTPVLVLDAPDIPPARVGEIDLGRQTLPGVPCPVSFIEYRAATGLPPYVPWHGDGTADRVWYVVSLVLALAQQGHRGDLLAPYGEIRDLAHGRVVGCRELVLPV